METYFDKCLNQRSQINDPIFLKELELKNQTKLKISRKKNNKYKSKNDITKARKAIEKNQQK